MLNTKHKALASSAIELMAANDNKPIELKADNDNDPVALVTKSLDDFKKVFEDRLTKVESKSDDEKTAERIDKLEARLNRPSIDKKSDDDESLETKAFFNVLRKGEARMDFEEQKALTVATSATAGYLAPESFASELIKLLKEFSPIRQYARVMQVGGPEIKYPRRIGSPTALWVAESAASAASQPSYEQISITPHELATYTDVTNQLLEDAAFNIQSELSQEFAEAFATAESLAFLSGVGNGSNQPVGLMTNADVAEMVTGHASAFPASNPSDVLVSLYHKLPTAHAQRGVWMMNRNTLAVIRKWKDSDGRYLVIDPITTGMPATMLGRPIVECLDMDDLGANKYPIVFGDLQGYRILDRIQLEVLRDPFARALNGEVRFHARKRVGGDVTHPDRFIKLKCSA